MWMLVFLALSHSQISADNLVEYNVVIADTKIKCNAHWQPKTHVTCTLYFELKPPPRWHLDVHHRFLFPGLNMRQRTNIIPVAAWMSGSFLLYHKYFCIYYMVRYIGRFKDIFIRWPWLRASGTGNNMLTYNVFTSCFNFVIKPLKCWSAAAQVEKSHEG